MREDLEFKRKTYKTVKEKEYKDVKDPSDLFEVDGRPAENIYILGEAGRGKTGQCYQLIQHWVEAREAQRESNELSKWQKGLLVFDFLFFVSLRHVDKRMHSVVEMICRSVMKTFPQYHDTINEILTSGFHKFKCLIVIDGLDERKGEVDIDVDMSRCTVLMTSRHWKFHDLAPDINDLDRVVEICGLGYNEREHVIEKVLVNYFGIDKKSTEFKTKVSEISTAAKDEKYKSIMNIPLLLTAFVHLWQSNKSLQESMTSFYAALLNLLIKLAFDNKRVTQISVVRQPMTEIDYPSLLTKQKKLRDHIRILVLIGKVAYEDLVLENEKIEYDEADDSECKRKGALQLVFEKDELIEKLGPEVLNFALEVGLLSQSSAPGSFHEENVSINFFHKTIEEFLAAMYLVCSDEVRLDSFSRYCSSIKSVMELSNILLFSVGLRPNLGSVISGHIARNVDSDTNIIRYRQGLGNKNEKITMEMMAWRNSLNQKVKRMFKTLCDCKQEMKYSLTQSETTQIGKFIISDVCVDAYHDDSTLAFSAEILSQDNGSIVSLHVEYGDIRNKSMFFQAVKEFLDKTSSLQTLHILKDRFFYSYGLGSYREDMPTFCSIGPIFSSLTSLSLEDITLTSDAACLLQKAIETNIKIQLLQLRAIYIKQNASLALDLRRKTSLRRIDNAYVAEFCLDMKANTRLRNLFLKQGIVAESLNILLVDITQCKSLINLTLCRVRFHSVDMLQTALSSFTQLKNLTLNHVSFSDKNQAYLNLNLCTNLMKLDLSEVHLKGVQISPLSLRHLRISHVSGSLRGLPSALRECQHLTDLKLSFIFLSDEQDADMCWDLKLCSRLTRLELSNVHVGSFDISPASLKQITISRVSGSLQGLLSSLRECQQLTHLDLDSLSDEHNSDLCLDLKACSRLTSLKLSKVHIGSFDISPVNLEDLTISSVSGSFRGLLSSLRECQQLKDLRLDSHSDEYMTDLCLDLKACSRLTRLELSNVHVGSFDISPVSLKQITISRVSGSLQGLLSSLRECQQLTHLDLYSLSDEHNSDLCLDIKACSRLTSLTLSKMHVDSSDISPVSLENLSLSNVSGSLRGLLSFLPQCQRLTYLSIFSLSVAQDVKLLADLLPRLTQVRKMTYEAGAKYVGRQRDPRNEGVVGYHSVVAQAATRMTGLERFTIICIDMGDLALTLTPLMTHIKDVDLVRVHMTASSWGQFMASLLTIQHGLKLGLFYTNIDNDSVSTVHTSPHFKVTQNDKADKEGEYSCLKFSKLPS